MAEYTVTSPVTDYCGTVGNVQFKNGQASTSDGAALAYFRSAGYTVDRIVTVAKKPTPASKRAPARTSTRKESTE